MHYQQAKTSDSTLARSNTVYPYDAVPLANGANVLTFYAADLAGNVTTANFTYTLSYAGRTNPPVVQLYWPQDGTQISGSSFTVRGMVDDFTTTLDATIVDTNGDTNTISAIVERDGKFWIENLPLAPGSNELTLTATDAATNVTTMTNTVMGSSLALTVNVDSTQLWQFTQDVGGTISDPTYSVWVNGVEGTNYGDGNWSATNVPINTGGTAVFQVRAIASSDNGGSGSGGGGTVCYSNSANPTSATAVDVESSVDKPPRWYVNNYTMGLTKSSTNCVVSVWSTNGQPDGTNTSCATGSLTDNFNWTDAAGGIDNWFDTASNLDGDCNGSTQVIWDPSFWPTLLRGACTLSNALCYDLGLYAGGCPAMEHCDINVPFNSTSAAGWNTESYIRKAQANMQYNTGGKAVPGTQNFYLFTATATDASGNPIPPEMISIGSLGHLDTNGNLWVVLPNGDPDPTPNVPGTNKFTFTLFATKYTLTAVPNCAVGSNPYRTTVGIDEQVTCQILPRNTKGIAVQWSNSGAGFINSSNGTSIQFTASSSPGIAKVTMSIADITPLTLTFNVIAPTGAAVSFNADIGCGATGTNSIGADTKFNLELLPTNVSFACITFRENGNPTNNVTWPNRTNVDLIYKRQTWLAPGNCGDSFVDEISEPLSPIKYLFNGANYVDFSYSRTWTNQYFNQQSNWVDFSTMTVITKYRGSDQKCQETYQGVSDPVWQGPWQATP